MRWTAALIFMLSLPVSAAHSFDAEVIDTLSALSVASTRCDGHAHDPAKIEDMQRKLGELWGWDRTDVESETRSTLQRHLTSYTTDPEAFCAEVTVVTNNLTHGTLEAIASN